MPDQSQRFLAHGDTVLFAGQDRRQYVRTLTPGGTLGTHLGTIRFDDLVGLPYGSRINTHLNKIYYVLIPQPTDLIAHARHETTIIQPKDLGYIAIKLGIQSGTRAIEAGTGSGALTLAMALLVGESGHVYSYDRKEALFAVALKNLNRAGAAVADRVTFTARDITEGFDQVGVDALFLDVPNPWDYLTQAHTALTSGGVFGAIVPTMNQAIDLVNALLRGAWFMIELEELIHRPYKITEMRIRPEDQIVGHTGYLVFARAVVPRQAEEPTEKPAETPTTEVPKQDTDTIEQAD